MPRTCTVCAHPERPAIDAALVAGEPYRGIAQRFAASPDAVLRHKAHVPAALARAQDAAAVAHADGLLGQVRDLQARTLAILAAAEWAGELRTALAAIGQARGNLELLAEMEGELDRRATVNVLVAPEWVAVRSALLEALQPYPDARQAVAGRLAALGAAS